MEVNNCIIKSKTIPDGNELKLFQNQIQFHLDYKMKILDIIKSQKSLHFMDNKKEDNISKNLDKNIKDLEDLNNMCNRDIEKLKQYLTYLDPKNREIISQESIIINEKSFIVPKCYDKDFDPKLVTSDEDINKFIEQMKITFEEIGKKIIELIKVYKEENKLTSLKNAEIKELQQLKGKYKTAKKQLEEFNGKNSNFK